jgi:tRNA pseudouridine55 synthase
LPLVVGRATRLAQFLSADEKEYLAGIRLGATTATYDAEERLVRNESGAPVLLRPVAHPPALTDAALRAALTEFTGTYWQVPPPFSAKKVGGTPAYRLARVHKDVELKPVEVTVSELELMSYAHGLAMVRVVCSSGFYVRSLANEVGARMGCGGHLESLRRNRAGEFRIDRAVPLSVIQEEGTAALQRLVPVESLLSRLPHVVVNERGARRAAHGNTLAAEDLWDADRAVPPRSAPGPVRVLDAEGALLAIGQPAGAGLLQPVVVLV